MKRTTAAFLFLLSFLTVFSTAADARRENMGEGYTTVNYKDIAHTFTMLGGVDMNNPDVADEYARMFFCPQFKAVYQNDLEWHKIRNLIVARVLEKKDHLRTLYETYGVFKLGRYDVESQIFPLTENTGMVNVGTMELFPREEAQIYCDNKYLQIFPRRITLVLAQPLTLTTFRIPMDQVKKVLARLDELKNTDREVYGRIRFRVTDAPGLVYSRYKDKIIGAELKGEVVAADFFLDSDMREALGSAQLSR